jgi:predicted lipoprotein with Yx(FWY)xxD motif
MNPPSRFRRYYPSRNDTEVVTMRWDRTLAAGAAGAALAVLVGCGGNGGSTGSSSGTGTGATVSSRSIQGVGSTLVDSNGRTLYFADQETNGTIKCVGDCVNFWSPLTIAAGTQPTAGPGIGGAVATVNRPDGTTQVTYDGKPLYTFTHDGGPGSAGGNGFMDSFAGTNFVWHAAAVSGTASTPDDNGGGNGYGY